MNQNTGPASILNRVPLWVFMAVVPVVALLAIAFTGFGSDTSATATSAVGGDGDAITIKDFTFSPETLTISAGTSITVTNRDDAKHTVTAVEGAFDTGDVDGGASASIAVDRPGTYAYFCEIHDYMTGTLRAT